MIPRWLIIAIIGTTAVLATSVSLLFVMANRGRTEGASPLKPDKVMEGLSIPDFAMTDHDGKPVDQTIFDGRVTVIDFFFTNCPFVCPGMTREMSNLTRTLAGTPVRFISFSVDPAHDTPERLREYALENKADLSRWTFLTGEYETVRKIVHDSLMFALGTDESRTIELGPGETMSNIMHPSKLVLIGPDRRVLAMYEYSIDADLEALAKRARLATAVLAARAR